MRKTSENVETKTEYVVEVLKAKEVKEGRVVFDMKVNGVTIYGCWYTEYTTKDGKDGTMVSFPSYKGDNGKFYNHTWFPVSTELKYAIVEQIAKLLK